MPKSINISEYLYDLPPSRIAKFPLAERDQSKLLVFREGQIQHRQFFELPDLLDDSWTLFFNNTKVLPARLPLKKPTGAAIEVFLLEPLLPSVDPVETLAAGSPSTWEAMIGNARKFKVDTSLKQKLTLENGAEVKLEVIRKENVSRSQQLVELHWQPEQISLAEVLEAVGQIPLPPYIERKACTEALSRDS